MPLSTSARLAAGHTVNRGRGSTLWHWAGARAVGGAGRGQAEGGLGQEEDARVSRGRGSTLQHWAGAGAGVNKCGAGTVGEAECEVNKGRVGG